VSATSADAAAPAVPKPGLRQVLASPKMLVIMILGAASGFPNQLTESALQAWLKDSGSSNTTIGIMSYVAIPYLLKFLWAPLMDRFPLPFLDRRRGWILMTQLALAATIASLAFQNPAESLVPVTICAIAIVFFSASQDIVFDAWRTDVAKPHERGLAAAATNVGYRAAAWIAAAVTLVLADFLGWHFAFLAVAGIMASFAIATWFAPSPEYTHAPPRTVRESIVEPLRELFGTKDAFAFIAIVMLFKVGDAFALKLFTPFMMDVGFSKTEISLVVKAVFTTSSIAGAVLGGIWMVRLGLLRSMLMFGVMQAVTNLLYYALAVTGKSYPLMVTATALDNIAGAMGNVASTALIMALCDTRFSAFQYALLSTLALLPRYALGGPAGWVADTGGWDTYYIVSFVIGLPGVLIVWLLRDKVRSIDMQRA
jgi:PAT family beta-lactamase induction signal transducer AmpG